MANLDWKKIGLVSVVAYLFSLPVMIWKSSRLGKILFIVGLIVALSNLLVMTTKKISEAYYSIDSIVQVDKKSKSLIENINSTMAEIVEIKNKLRDSKQEFEEFISESKKSQSDKIIKSSQKIEADLSTIEKSVKALKSDLRESFLDRCLLLRENILIKKYSLDTYETRKEMSDLMESSAILDETEKERFYDELKALGFEVIKKKEEAMKYIPQSSMMFISSDAVAYRRWDED